MSDRELLALAATGARAKDFALWVYALRAMGLDYGSLPIQVRAGARRAGVRLDKDQTQARTWCAARSAAERAQ